MLDCSGSMKGESIEQAMTALELCLRSLSPGDTFNICRFGSNWDTMCDEPVHYSQVTLDMAVRFVRSSRDMGGTELYKPLQAILTTQPAVGNVRQVILLTDGQVTNEPAILELARCHRSKNRIFSFGIGPACSTHLVRGLARATGGAAEFITAGERIDEKVLRTFSRIASPPITDIRLDWDGCDVQTLAEIPPVFDGDVLPVFGRAMGRVPKQVTLSCNTASGPKTWAVRVPPPEPDDGVIATMWARRTIQSLEEVNAISRTARTKSSPERETDPNLQGFRLALQFDDVHRHRAPVGGRAKRRAACPAKGAGDAGAGLGPRPHPSARGGRLRNPPLEAKGDETS